jgi:hypothetical protein
MGTGLYWHIVADGSSYGAILNEVTGLFTPGASNAHIRVEVAGDTYAAFVDGSSLPATALTTSAFASGQVALYDFSNQTFDNVVVATPDGGGGSGSAPANPEPSTLVLLGLGGLGLLGAAWRHRCSARGKGPSGIFFRA